VKDVMVREMVLAIPQIVGGKGGPKGIGDPKKAYCTACKKAGLDDCENCDKQFVIKD